jgi:hypothetical protein
VLLRPCQIVIGARVSNASLRLTFHELDTQQLLVFRHYALARQTIPLTPIAANLRSRTICPQQSISCHAALDANEAARRTLAKLKRFLRVRRRETFDA